ncbi:FRG domain-containing protein [Aeromonas salmonicida]
MLIEKLEIIVRNNIPVEPDASWIECEVKTWRQFERIIDELDSGRWLFRGQTDASWGLKTSLYRLFEDFPKSATTKSEKEEYEKEIIRSFKANAHLYGINNVNEESSLEWLSIMQHYGAPTRLLDVSHSAYIASYFALESGHNDCAIFCFNYGNFKKIDENFFDGEDYKNNLFNNKFKGDFLIAYEPNRANERLLLQQGLFLVPNNINQTFDHIVNQYGDETKCVKIIIPKKLRLEGLKKLYRMNISAVTLFPGIDGFCKSLRTKVINSLDKLAPLE